MSFSTGPYMEKYFRKKRGKFSGPRARTVASDAPFHMLLMLEWLRAFKESEMELPPGDEHTQGSYANRAVAMQTPQGKLRDWVEENYTHVPLSEKDTGSKLDVLFTAYVTCVTPIHAKVLGKILFGKMLNAIYPNIGPHRDTCSSMWIYLLR